MDGFEKLPAVEEKGCCKEALAAIKKKQQWKREQRMKRRLD
jgi:hypothetical protein